MEEIEKNQICFLHRKEKRCSDCGRDFSSSNWNNTLKH